MKNDLQSIHPVPYDLNLLRAALSDSYLPEDQLNACFWWEYSRSSSVVVKAVETMIPAHPPDSKRVPAVSILGNYAFETLGSLRYPFGKVCFPDLSWFAARKTYMLDYHPYISSDILDKLRIWRIRKPKISSLSPSEQMWYKNHFKPFLQGKYSQKISAVDSWMEHVRNTDLKPIRCRQYPLEIKPEELFPFYIPGDSSGKPYLYFYYGDTSSSKIFPKGCYETLYEIALDWTHRKCMKLEDFKQCFPLERPKDYHKIRGNDIVGITAQNLHCDRRAALGWLFFLRVKLAKVSNPNIDQLCKKVFKEAGRSGPSVDEILKQTKKAVSILSWFTTGTFVRPHHRGISLGLPRKTGQHLTRTYRSK